jgi:hypothetical protein
MTITKASIAADRARTLPAGVRVRKQFPLYRISRDGRPAEHILAAFVDSDGVNAVHVQRAVAQTGCLK